jgi:hypothetical protein
VLSVLYNITVDHLPIAGIIAGAQLDPYIGVVAYPAFHHAKERHVLNGDRFNDCWPHLQTIFKSDKYRRVLDQ